MILLIMISVKIFFDYFCDSRLPLYLYVGGDMKVTDMNDMKKWNQISKHEKRDNIK
jgi:hypothetical protein